MAEPTNAPLGSPQAGGSYEDDEKAMRSGKGRMLAAMIVAVLASGIGLTWYVMQGDASNSYREFGKTVNGLHNNQWLKFWECSLQSGAAYERVKTNTDLKLALDQRASRGGARFGGLIRDRCMPRLAEMHDHYAALLPPPDLAEKVRAVATAADALRAGFSEYIAFLDAAGASYDAETSGPPIMKIAKAWFDYKNAFNALNRELRKKIDGA